MDGVVVQDFFGLDSRLLSGNDARGNDEKHASCFAQKWISDFTHAVLCDLNALHAFTKRRVPLRPE